MSCPNDGFICIASQKPWTQQLPRLPTYEAGEDAAQPGVDYYEIQVTSFRQWFGLYEPNRETRLYSPIWGYGQVGHTYDTGVRDANGNVLPQTGSHSAPSFLAERNRPVSVKWMNELRDEAGAPLVTHLLDDGDDMTLMGADASQPRVRTVTHLHGAEVPPESDGYPMGTVTPGHSQLYTYPNRQPAATLWYHDHAMAITRLNMLAIGSGFYILKDSMQEATLNLPRGKYDIPMAIRDLMVTTDGRLSAINSRNSPATMHHPKWSPEFFGNIITVNGMAWPTLDVEPRKYRFRILNASNARMYNLHLFNEAIKALHLEVWLIATDGGYLKTPVKLSMTPVDTLEATDRSDKLFLAPAERAEVVVDFSGLAPGTTLSFLNDAPSPFPDGDGPAGMAADVVMQFKVVAAENPDLSALPPTMNPNPTKLSVERASVRRLVLTEIEDPVTTEPLVALLNNTCFDEAITERPKLGSTEIWEIVNGTEDTHPIHLHLVQFNVLNRQLFDRQRYLADWVATQPGNHGLSTPRPTCGAMHFPDPPGVDSEPQWIPAADRYLLGSPIAPADSESGWKDTARVKAGTVTRFAVRFAPHDPTQAGGYGGYVFNPTTHPYVWHCHMLEHEDHGMMRPYLIVN